MCFKAIRRWKTQKYDYEMQIAKQDRLIAHQQDEINELRRQISMIVGMYPDVDQQPCPPPPKGE